MLYIYYIYFYRVLGSLLASHLIIADPKQPFGDMRPPNYDGELLHMAHDLAVRLLPAFDAKNGIPFPRVSDLAVKCWLILSVVWVLKGISY